jgi:hypothetical protein
MPIAQRIVEHTVPARNRFFEQAARSSHLPRDED